MKFPDFIGLGCQKSMTTSLYHYLCQHSQVIPNNYKKEIKFWNYPENYKKGIDWYKSCFTEVEGKITGEITSNYFWYIAPQIVYNDLPKTTKLIVIFRNPIDRMYSFYWWLKTRYSCKRHKIKDNFAKSVYCFMEESDYLYYLKNWIEVFGKERIHIIIAEELVKLKPQKTFNKLCDYLKIKHFTPIFKKFLKQNYPPMDRRIRINLEYIFKPINKKFFEYIEKDNVWL